MEAKFQANVSGGFGGTVISDSVINCLYIYLFINVHIIEYKRLRNLFEALINQLAVRTPRLWT